MVIPLEKERGKYDGWEKNDSVVSIIFILFKTPETNTVKVSV